MCVRVRVRVRACVCIPGALFWDVGLYIQIRHYTLDNVKNVPFYLDMEV